MAVAHTALSPFYDEQNVWEIGLDEAGRGPMFGRLYVAAVVLPKVAFQHEKMKDSKKFHSKKKIQDVADYIKEHATAWSVHFIEADVIDQINIRQAVFRGMHACIRDIVAKQTSLNVSVSVGPVADPFLLVDGNDFTPYTVFDETTEEIRAFPHVTIEGGDNKYTAIAAASILAKVARDQYIEDLCAEFPDLVSKYGLNKNMGYGTKQHLNGIAEHGITQWHRKTFGLCKTAAVVEVVRPDVLGSV